MATLTRGLCRSMMTFSRVKSFRKLEQASSRLMGQYTKGIKPKTMDKEQARAFLQGLDERSRVCLKDQLHELDKREVLQYLTEEIDEIISDSHEEEQQKKKPVTVSRQELIDVFIFNGFPFIGFGFLDNFIMIAAGEFIDTQLGVYFTMSTMAAAGFGNLISDVIGVATASWVESVASKFGVRVPDLTKEQAAKKSVLMASGTGRTAGIIFGCLIGMFPLLFFSSKEEKEAGKAAAEAGDSASDSTPASSQSQDSSKSS